MPLIPVSTLSQLSANTTIGGAIAIADEAFAANSTALSMIASLRAFSLRPHIRPIIDGVNASLLQATGSLLVAVQHQEHFLPVIQFELPTSATAASNLLRALNDSGIGQGGNDFWNQQLGMVTLKLRWHDNRLILSTATNVTSFRQQIAQQNELKPGSTKSLFTDHATVSDTIATLPATEGQQFVIVRRDAVARQLTALSAMLSATDPESGQRLQKYLDHTQEKPQADWVMTWRQDNAWHTKATGVAGATLLVGGLVTFGANLSPMANN